jgi:hypothetical protein
VSKSVRYALLFVASAAFASASANADTSVVLKANEGYDFVKHAVIKSGNMNADVSFAVNKQAGGAVAALSAKKIKNLGSDLPDATAFMGVQQWPGAVANPAPGYYAVQGHDGRSIYLVQLLAFDNPGKMATNWHMSFTYERLQ